jgi:uncharacterized protein YjbI with pentapeptide repeats
MLKIDAAEIRRSYALGERNFAKLNLSHANLQGVNLSYANLKGANLRKANLTGAMLDGSNLEGANLEGADLTGADLNRANLKTANLNQCELLWISLVQADLRQASLRQSILEVANLTEANLRGADLSGASLCGTNFNGTDLWGAFYNDRTLFNEGFDPDTAQMQAEVVVTVWELLSEFNLLSESKRRCLGSALVARYWEVTRPEIDWLKRFKINTLGQIACGGRLSETVETLHLHWSYSWMNAFITGCSQAVKSHPDKTKQSSWG